MIPERYKSASIDDFDKDKISPIMKWINGDKKDILFIAGSSGCGKTHLMCAICYYLIKLHIQAAYALIPEISIQLRNSMNTDFDNNLSEYDVIKKYRNPKLIGLFDDLAANKPSEYVSESLYAIINHRYQEVSPSVYSSNLSISEISELYGDRIASRLASGIVFKMAGIDMRLVKNNALR